ncbi:MAG TPA: methyltransferase domain-containing protein [Gaiellaceae bacterium]|jgi:SAM-dependent methyltransferase
MKSRFLRLLDPLLQSALAERVVVTGVRLWSSGAARLEPAEGLRRLLRLDDHLHERIDGIAIELDGGVHAKHRLTGYHEFFVRNVGRGDRVLDVGCGKGELAYDLAVDSGAAVTGIDVSRSSLDFARARFQAPGLEFVEGDVLAWESPHDYDVVVLSNVLEHVGPRVELLRRLSSSVHPDRFLIRVPSEERDWLVPLREELGLPHFSDPTHETEYTVDQLRAELGEAGIGIEELVQRWGELWAVGRPAEPADPGAILGR